jgi:aminoglycoside/choline kinase family phosphotransferase
MRVAQSFYLTSSARSHQRSPRWAQQVQSFVQISILLRSHQESIPLQLGVISRRTYPSQEGSLLKVAQDYERISSARHVHLFCVLPCAVQHELHDDHQPFVRFSFQKVFSRLVDVLSSSPKVYVRFSFQKA